MPESIDGERTSRSVSVGFQVVARRKEHPQMAFARRVCLRHTQERVARATGYLLQRSAMPASLLFQILDSQNQSRSEAMHKRSHE